MSAMNSLALNRIDGTQAESIKDTVDAIQVTPDSELPPSVATSTACLSSQQGKVPLRLASCSNSCGVPPQASVKQQQPQTSKKQRISSTSSVCTTSSKKSCKSTASQIQEVAGDASSWLTFARLPCFTCCIPCNLLHQQATESPCLQSSSSVSSSICLPACLVPLLAEEFWELKSTSLKVAKVGDPCSIGLKKGKEVTSTWPRPPDQQAMPTQSSDQQATPTN
ncbi:uncharacterized protein LOC117675449 isoform X1 [Pantherophis guttatus]|uniref:Uncharacterized protein LOC117675449 isoform X1 n=1 Tax=Pantherophis guttatus TaxID=94885 RepID=A0ABM3YTB7_PANGU|nr:uncharacterized protein LOC117675449 isoform X1 [Pantherophis guttatus]